MLRVSVFSTWLPRKTPKCLFDVTHDKATMIQMPHDVHAKLVVQPMLSHI